MMILLNTISIQIYVNYDPRFCVSQINALDNVCGNYLIIILFTFSIGIIINISCFVITDEISTKKTITRVTTEIATILQDK